MMDKRTIKWTDYYMKYFVETENKLYIFFGWDAYSPKSLNTNNSSSAASDTLKKKLLKLGTITV